MKANETENHFNGLILLAGSKGAGKTEVAEKLCDKYGFKILPTFTTKPYTAESSTYHTYITNEEFDAIPEKDRLSYTEHNGSRYCTTVEQLKDYDIFIIDFQGVKSFKREYHGHKPIYTIYLYVTAEEQKKRLEEHGETPEDIIKYLQKDSEERFSEQINLFVGRIIDNTNHDLAIKQIEEYIFEQKTKKSLSEKFINFRFKVSTKTRIYISKILNWYEIFWRKETIKEIQAKLEKLSSPELEERLAYEKEMLEYAENNPTGNHLKEIFKNVKEKGWY